MVCRTDIKTAVRYLRDAAEYYAKTATSVRHEDRARLMRKLANKINNKLNSTEHEKENTKGGQEWLILLIKKLKKKSKRKGKNMSKKEEMAREYSFNIPREIYSTLGTDLNKTFWEAEIEMAFVSGWDTAEKAITDKACNWMKEQEEIIGVSFTKDFIERFCKAMDEQTMTIEEKARAYDKALENAKKWSKNPTVWSSDDICQKIFPELIENRGVMIKKELIQYIKRLTEIGYLLPEYSTEWIAWLEKQKDSVYNEECKESEDESIRKELYIYLDWLDGRKDYAPKGKYTIRDMIAWLEKQGGQKHAWSEEDEENLQNCCGAIGAADYYTYEDKQEMEAWLKSLKTRLGCGEHDNVTSKTTNVCE